MVAAINYPKRVTKFVMGGSHIGTGGDRYLMANRPSEGSRATQQTIADPATRTSAVICACISTTKTS
jgi:2-hydroxy-6-oxonona-2,4-dienedioate hydrolase